MEPELFPTSPNKGEQARRRLLLAALRKFGEKGYENASLRDIADDAGQNVAAISYYFGNKEKLYAAVLEGIGDYLRVALGPLVEEGRTGLERGTLDRTTAVEVLKRMLRGLLGRQLEGTEFAKIRLVMMREQAAPSESFELLYRKTLKPLHEFATRVLAVATGEDPESPTLILRAHAIFGQVLTFTLTRATILRRLGAGNFTPEHVAAIGVILDEHLDRICGTASTHANAS